MSHAPGYVAISLTLVTRAPLRVGAGRQDALIDLPVEIGADGKPYVPGTGLAGALRAAVCPDLDWFWGSTDDASGSASLITVCDAPITPAKIAAQQPVRGRTAIDPRTGIASDGKLFTEETVAPGATVHVRLTLDRATLQTRNGSRDLDVAAALIETVRRDGLSLGAGWGQGLGGDAELQRAEVIELAPPSNLVELGRFTDVVATLTPPTVGSWTNEPAIAQLVQSGATWAQARKDHAQWLEPAPIASIALALESDDGSSAMTLDSDAAGTFAHVLATRETPNGRIPVLHGSGVRGALRAQAERILATVVGASGVPEAAARVRALTRGLPTDVLFGLSDARAKLLAQAEADEVDEAGQPDEAAAAGAASTSAQPPTWKLGAGALRVEDILGSAEIAISGAQWEQLLGSTEIDEQVRALLREITWADQDDAGAAAQPDADADATGNREAVPRAAFHAQTMLPRSPWTGGGVPTGPFTRLEARPEAGQELFEKATLRIDRRRLPEDDPSLLAASIVLLALTLLDWSDGEFAIGFGGARGLGRLRPTTAAVAAPDGIPADEKAPGAEEPAAAPPPVALGPGHRGDHAEHLRALITTLAAGAGVDEDADALIDSWARYADELTEAARKTDTVSALQEGSA
ncbi:MAG: RAMP superfamily CRISPR-associated protein [Patulibacter sp.]